MIRILGQDLPQSKRVIIGLQYVYGIGPALAKKLCSQLQIPDSMRVKDMKTELVSEIINQIKINAQNAENDQWKTQGDLRRKINEDITSLQHINCRRGIRLRSRLPVRGQRTKSNARVAKGKAGATAISRKKK